MIPAIHNLTAYRGDSWSQTFRFLADGAPIDLTGASVACEARNAAGTVYTLAASTGAPGEVTLGPLPDELAAAAYDYDVEVTDGTQVQTWVRGRLSVTRDVTNELP